MALHSGISWTDHTQNFWMGCDKVGPGCAHCYINRTLIKLGHEPWGEVFRTSKQNWTNPAKWEKIAAKRGRSLRVFTCSESDFFHEGADPWRPEAWEVIKNTPHLTWQILTKRPGRIASHLPMDWGEGYNNVWLGVSCACAVDAVLLDKLRHVPAALRFISAEPLLEDIAPHVNLQGFGWLIAGGESGRNPEYLWKPGTPFLKEQVGRRTMKLDWAVNLREKCIQSGVAFYFKQVTSGRSGHKPDALGKYHYNFPAGPFPWYSADEYAQDFSTKSKSGNKALAKKLVQIEHREAA